MASIPEDVPDPAFDGYSLGAVLGTGLAGAVRAAGHTSGFDVAIEVIGAPLTDDEGFRQRLGEATDEAAVLEHPSIVSVYKTLWDGDTAGVVTELVDCASAARLLRESPLSLAATCLVADSVLLALVIAHRAGVIHGRVCADAVLLDGDRVRLAGFAVGRAMHADAVAEPVTDTHGVARLVEELAGEAAAPRALRRVLTRGTAQRIDHRYRTASSMRTALATAARRELGDGWRAVAASELASLPSRGAAAEGAAVPVPSPVEPAGAAPVSAAPAEQPEPSSGPATETAAVQQEKRQVSPAVPAMPVIRAAPSGFLFRRVARRPGARTMRTATLLLVAAAIVGALGGMLASAIRGGAPAAAGALSVARPVSVQLQPVHGTCNSVFAATATGHVRGAGTLVYRWERSDGLQTEDTTLNVARNDATFLITEHWQLDGAVAHPSITFRLVSPVAMAVTRALGYSCP
ncbi:MAG TPA: protein kinase [Candidatus Dormibacteraeota bacterium]